MHRDFKIITTTNPIYARKYILRELTVTSAYREMAGRKCTLVPKLSSIDTRD